MDYSDRRYDEEEVSAIIRRALSKRASHDTIGHDDLLEIARHSGISPEELEGAIDEQEVEGDMEWAREQWIERRRARFYRHVRSYVIVIGALLLINMATRGGPWVIWPVIVWGIFLAFDASDTYFISRGRVERGARLILRRRHMMQRLERN